MKKYLTKERSMLIVGLLVLVLGLTSCNGLVGVPLDKFDIQSEGILIILSWPIGWIMNLIGSIFPEGSGQFAWGLLFTTLIVRTLAWPIYAKTNDMSLKMAVAQPEIQRLQEKYANRKDPQAQQRMQQEMMAIYKKHKISFAGCFAPFIQMPIFMAMYNVVTRLSIAGGALSLTDTAFFGIKDCLSVGVTAAREGVATAEAWSPAFIVGIVLSLLVGVTMWLVNHFAQKKPSYQKNTHTHNANNQQANQMAGTMKFMNYFMIVMMVVASLSSNALALYWVIGNIYSIIQGFINRYLNEKKYYKMKQENTIDNLI